uniref:Leukotriene C4 synthase-like n=1 Tax=Gouania willdenowi TaxID=441366 RepID=A0A8C5DGR2_GOUWI
MSAHQQRFWFKKRKACQWVGLIAGAGWPRPFTPVCVSSCVTDTHTQMKMMECVSVAAVTVLAVLQQVYFSLQVIYARRRFRVSPPVTVGPPQFDRIYRAQFRVNCSEYFPLFITLMWISGVFLSPGESVTSSSSSSSSSSLCVRVCVCACSCVLSVWSPLPFFSAHVFLGIFTFC